MSRQAMPITKIYHRRLLRLLFVGFCMGGCGGIAEASDQGTGTVAQGGTPGTGGTLSTSSECGDPALLSRIDLCMAATESVSCAAAGGTWTESATSSSCECPTGQGSCPCNKNSQCRGSCIAELTAPNDCAGVASGQCSPIMRPRGCYCWFLDTSETPKPLCGHLL